MLPWRKIQPQRQLLAATCLVEMETLIPAPAPRQAKNISAEQQPPPPPFLICSCICSAILGAARRLGGGDVWGARQRREG